MVSSAVISKQQKPSRIFIQTSHRIHTIRNIQKIEDGDRLDGRKKAEDEFEADETAVADLADLEEATEVAWKLARPEGIVLLAPACSSFDMFGDFIQRGEIFQTAVQRIITREAVIP